MKTYSNYKDSGVQWIGEVPSHWEILAFKYCMKINNGQDYKHILVDEGYPVFGSGGPFAFASQFIYDGEVVMLGRKGTIDKPLYYKGKFWTVDTMFYAIPTKRSVCRFMYYLARTFPFNYYSTATALPSMTQFDLGNNPIALPPLPEQQAIASFLDAKTKPIDDIIAKREKQIELLEEMKSAIISRAVTKGLNPEAKMKDSGIEWIGKVPEGWEISKVKYIASVCGRIGYRGYTTNDLVSAGEGALTIGGKHITHNYLNLSDPDYISWEKYYESPEIMLEKGDIVMAQRGSLGKSALIDREIGEATINPSLVILKRIKTNGVFLHYYLISNMMQDYINLINTATAVPMISQNQIENIPIALPPLSEQQAIASYLDSETSKIDTRIAKRRKQIELLQEYKQALITAAVTGKIDVREYIP